MKERKIVQSALAVGLTLGGPTLPGLSLEADPPTPHVMQSTDKKYPTKEEVEAQIAERNKNELSGLGVVSLLSACVVGSVIYARRKYNRYEREKSLYLTTAEPVYEKDAAIFSQSLYRNAIPKKDVKRYGKDLMERGGNPKHEFSTTNKEGFINVAKSAGIPNRKIYATVLNYDTLLEEKPNPESGTVKALIIQAFNKKDQTRYETKIGKRFYRGN